MLAWTSLKASYSAWDDCGCLSTYRRVFLEYRRRLWETTARTRYGSYWVTTRRDRPVKTTEDSARRLRNNAAAERERRSQQSC